jgi:hypothetical protein
MNQSPARRSNLFRLPLAALLAAGLLPLAGCNRGPEFARVEGTITLDGKPLDNAEVVFLPDPEKGNQGPCASAYTDEQGHYRLFCEKANQEGAVVGRHRVCVHDLAAVAPPPDPNPTPAGGKAALPPLPAKGKPSRVPAAYDDPSHTPLRDVEVKPGRQTLDFTVKR